MANETRAALQLLGGAQQKFAEEGQEIANEEAAIAGQQLALDNPNQQPGYAFTEAAKVKREVYLNTSTELNISDAQRKMQELADLATSQGNLGPGSLNTYRKDAEAIMKGYIQSAPRERKGDIAMTLDKVYKSLDLTVGKKVEKYNEVYQQAEFENVLTGYLSDAEKAYLQGNKEYGDVLTAQARKVIDQATSSGIMMGPVADRQKAQIDNQSQQFKSQVDLTQKSSVMRYNLREAMANGQGESFLNNYIDNPPKGLSEEEYRTIGKDLYQEYQFVDRLKGKQQTINYNNLSSSIERGEITDLKSLEEASQFVSGTQRAKLTNEFLSKKAKDQSDTSSVYHVWSMVNSNDVNIANASPTAISNAFTQSVNAQKESYREQLIAAKVIDPTDPTPAFPLIEEAYIAAKIPVPVPAFQKKLEVIALSGSPEQRVEAAMSYRYMVDNNKQAAISGLNTKTRAYLNLITTGVNAGMSYGQAVTMADNQMNVPPNVLTEREESWKTYASGKNKLTLEDWKQKFANDVSPRWFGMINTNIENVPDGVGNVVRDLTYANYVMTGDFEQSYDNAVEQLSTVYGKDEVGGTNRIVLLPPEKSVPGYNGNAALARNSFAKSVKQLAAEYKNLGDLSVSMDEEIDVPGTAQGMIKQNDGKIYLKVDGKERQVVPVADYLTLNPMGQFSYGLQYKGDSGQMETLKLPNGLLARWVPDNAEEAMSAAQAESNQQNKRVADINQQRDELTGLDRFGVAMGIL